MAEEKTTQEISLRARQHEEQAAMIKEVCKNNLFLSFEVIFSIFSLLWRELRKRKNQRV